MNSCQEPSFARQNHSCVSREGEACPPPSSDAKPWFCVAGRRGMPPPHLQRRKSTGSRDTNLVCVVPGFVSQVWGRLALPPSCDAKPKFCVGSLCSRPLSHVCLVTHQTRRLRHKAGMSTVRLSRHVCCVTQQTCLLRHIADMSAA